MATARVSMEVTSTLFGDVSASTDVDSLTYADTVQILASLIRETAERVCRAYGLDPEDVLGTPQQKG